MNGLENWTERNLIKFKKRTYQVSGQGITPATRTGWCPVGWEADLQAMSCRHSLHREGQKESFQSKEDGDRFLSVVSSEQIRSNGQKLK